LSPDSLPSIASGALDNLTDGVIPAVGDVFGSLTDLVSPVAGADEPDAFGQLLPSTVSDLVGGILGGSAYGTTSYAQTTHGHGHYGYTHLRPADAFAEIPVSDWVGPGW
jgi:hypothetical protein